MNRRFYNTEYQCIVTLEELREWFETEADEAEREGGFSGYVGNCCSKNGYLVPIPDKYAQGTKLYYDFCHGDVISWREVVDRLEFEYHFDEFTPMSEMWEYFMKIN